MKMKNTLTYCFLLCVVFGITRNNASGQEAPGKAKHQFVVMPRDVGLPVVVVQPESPLEFVETHLLVNVDTGLWIPSFRLRNRGTKPIRAFTIGFAGSDERGWKADNANQYFMPGHILTLNDDESDEIVPLTESLRGRLRLSGPMKGIMVLLVVSVQYADGSGFQESGYEALGEYLFSVSGVLNDPRVKQTGSSSPRPPR